MDTSKHDFVGLFEQLGLPADPPAIDFFLSTHRLDDGVPISEAAFWNPAQAEFLAEELEEDGDWAEIIDELAMMLNQPPTIH
ncbi:DUF2789 family protein [Andreprevotia chitinilytica]|uniref:DUF2789 family protein n=1 Tax=Andreprevotia chitinilytica TaxID=396808 RepID=UPI00054F0705|nr:DUF2789 family protein [Andreprevotia chitinilytica]